MKNFLKLVLVLFFITSCSVSEKPEFVKVDNVKLLSANAGVIKIKAEAFFENPNIVGGEISSNGIQVIVNGAEVAHVSSESFKVPAQEEFVVPLNVVIPTKKIFENNKNGILGGLINSVLNKSIKVQFKGDLNYKVLGVSNVYPVDVIEEIKL